MPTPLPPTAASATAGCRCGSMAMTGIVQDIELGYSLDIALIDSFDISRRRNTRKIGGSDNRWRQ